MKNLKLCHSIKEVLEATPGEGFITDTIYVMQSYIKSGIAKDYIEAMECLNIDHSAIN